MFRMGFLQYNNRGYHVSNSFIFQLSGGIFFLHRPEKPKVDPKGFTNDPHMMTTHHDYQHGAAKSKITSNFYP